MGINCKWKNVLGYGIKEENLPNGKKIKERITFYGGGNCTTCMCYKNKNLYNFIIDKAHIKNLIKDNVTLELNNITLYAQTDKEEQKRVYEIINYLYKTKQEFKFINDLPWKD